MEFHFGNAWTALAGPWEAPALVCEGQTRGWAELRDRAGSWLALGCRGLSPGRSSGSTSSIATNTRRRTRAFKLGACPINVNYRYQADEFVYRLENSDAEAVLFHSRFAGRIEQIRPRLPGWLYLQVDDGSEAPLLAGAVAFEGPRRGGSGPGRRALPMTSTCCIPAAPRACPRA